MRVEILSIEHLSEAAKTFAEQINGRTLFAFYGNMGAGKTTFIKSLCEVLGVVDDVVNSPTFSIVNEYVTNSGSRIFHFDFYRLKNYTEAIDLGLFDYFNSGALCFMEWPEMIEEILPEDVVAVHLNVDDNGVRTLEWQ